MDENKVKNNLKTIHTYTSDMADAVRENEMTVIKIALAEKEKREREELYKKASGTPISKLLLLLGGFIFIGGALAGGYFLYMKNKETDTAPVVRERAETIISRDAEASLDVTNIKTEIELGKFIKEEASKAGTPTKIKSIFLNEKINNVNQPLPLSNLISLLGLDAPSSLVRTFDEDYMIGSYTNKLLPKEGEVVKNTNLFFIFKIKDYNQAYASMLAWEDYLLSDMFILFGTDVSGERGELFDKPWKDIILDNKDARILYDKNGEDILYYIFLNKETLVITDSKEAIKEINLRLLAKATKPI